MSIDDILRCYGELLASVDVWFSHCMEESGESIACRTGCSECCRGLFDITLLDAFYLRQGFDRLESAVRQAVLEKANFRLAELQMLWPDFVHPFLLNIRPEEEWEELMPDSDETPCPLLGDDSRCLVYSHRPMTCRLHGLPLIDLSGEIMHDEWCTLNFTDEDPLKRIGLRGDFDRMFRDEVTLFRLFSSLVFKKNFSSLDTFIPTALLLDLNAAEGELWKAVQLLP